MEFDKEFFCQRVRELRKVKGLNKFQMSIQANIIYQNYCDIENGKRLPNLKIVISIANALKTDLSTLLNSNDDSSKVALKINTMANLREISNKDTLNKFHDVLLFIKTQGAQYD